MTEKIPKPNQAQIKPIPIENDVEIERIDDSGKKEEFVIPELILFLINNLGAFITQTPEDIMPKKSNRPKKQIDPLKKH